LRKITKIKRCIKAISPVISVLLMIAIAVVAALVAYAWVMGYIGNKTSQSGKTIDLQSFTTEANLVIYVQNTGQGTVHLKYDSAVYVNDVLKNILRVDGKDVQDVQDQQGLIPVKMGQTVQLTIDYIPQPNEQLRIKVVTVEGTFMQILGYSKSGTSGSGGSGSGGSGGSGNSGGSGSPATATVTFSAGTGGTVSPSGTISGILVGSVYSIIASPNSGYAFSSWTFSGPIQINNPTDASSTVQITAAGTGSLTGNFVEASNPKLFYLAGDSQSILVNSLSSVIKIERQDSSGNPITTGTTLVSLSTTSSGIFCSDSAGTNQVTSVTISESANSADVWYKDANVGTPTLTASAINYSPISTTFNINNPETEPTPTPTNGGTPTPTPTPTNGGTPTPTPTPLPTAPSGSLLTLSTGFDGNPWDQYWRAGGNPPWYAAAGQGIDGSTAAKSDPYGANDGPFTSDPIDVTGGTVIHISFMYKVHQTNSASDLRIAYSNKASNLNLSPNSPDFTYPSIGRIGRPAQDDVWYSYSITIAKTTTAGADIVDASAFATGVFNFRFESSLRTGVGGVVEQVWVDNVLITVDR
jgi:flagellin-like protein